MNEVWKKIDGYGGRYSVSDLGSIRNDDKGNVFKPQTNTWGYQHVELKCKGIGKTVTIHKLVANAFIPFEEGKNQINHKDENKKNNCLSNLERCTAKYNVNYGIAPSIRAEKRSKPVAQLDANGTIISKFKSAREVSKILGFCYKHISDCCNGRRKTHQGYGWKFI